MPNGGVPMHIIIRPQNSDIVIQLLMVIARRISVMKYIYYSEFLPSVRTLHQKGCHFRAAADTVMGIVGRMSTKEEDPLKGLRLTGGIGWKDIEQYDKEQKSLGKKRR